MSRLGQVSLTKPPFAAQCHKRSARQITKAVLSSGAGKRMRGLVPIAKFSAQGTGMTRLQMGLIHIIAGMMGAYI